MTTLVDALAEQGIRLKSYAAGTTQRLRCPRCEGGRQKEQCLAVTIDGDGQGAVWTCHRGKCGWTHGIAVRESGERRPPKKVKAPPRRPAPPRETPRPKPLMDYLCGKRGFSEEVVAELGLYLTRAWFPDLDREDWAIAFPYRREGELISIKYRTATGKHWAQEKGCERILYNLDDIADDELIWVEGEPDVAALMTAGFRSVTTLPDGSVKKLKAEDDPSREDDKRFEAMGNCADKLEPIKKVIIATDADQPGQNLAEEIARRLGKERCWLLRWPEGIKDANEFLLARGAEALRAHVIEAPEPYPIDGVFELPEGSLLRLRNSPRESLYPAPWQNLRPFLRFPSGGALAVVTGVPNAGKSSWVNHMMVLLAERYGWHWCVFSPEAGDPDEHASELVEQHVGLPFRQYSEIGDKPMDDFHVMEAEDWVRQHFTWVRAEREDQQADLDFLLARSRAVILRRGTRGILLDPWNEIEHTRPRELTEHEYVGKSLQLLRRFARQHGVLVVIVAHPTKLQKDKAGKHIVPGGYEISGSSNFFNKPDVGLTIHRPDPQNKIVEAHIWKARKKQWGTKGSGFLVFDRSSSRYIDHDEERDGPPPGR